MVAKRDREEQEKKVEEEYERHRWPDEYQDMDYVAHQRARNRINMPTAYCRVCNKGFKPWSEDVDETGWPMWDDVRCPTCNGMVRVFKDKSLEKEYYSDKLFEGSEVQKQFIAFKKEILRRFEEHEKQHDTLADGIAERVEAKIILWAKTQHQDEKTHPTQPEDKENKKQDKQGLYG